MLPNKDSRSGLTIIMLNSCRALPFLHARYSRIAHENLGPIDTNKSVTTGPYRAHPNRRREGGTCGLPKYAVVQVVCRSA